MKPTLLFIAIAIGIALVTWFFIYLKKRQDAMEAEFQLRFQGKRIRLLDKVALFVAQESDGYSHARGVGYLVLTDDELYFERRVAKKVVQIPIGSITGVGETRKLAGQSTLRTMLKIEFIGTNGKSDSMALCVKELEEWKNAIASSIGRST